MARPHWSERPWHEAAPKPQRAYAFRKRVDRQRIAQALGQGRRAAEIAKVERCAVEDIEKLLADRTFQALVRHWEEIAALDPEARLERLTAMALDLIELAIASGDLRVAMFVAHERGQQRNPGRTVAQRTIKAMERAAARTEPPAERSPPDGLPVTATPPDADREPFAFCAPTLGSNAHAAHLAEAELARVPSRLARARQGLAKKLAAECERAGTALPQDPIGAARALGKALRRDGARAIEAAVGLDAHWRAYKDGLPPPVPEGWDSG